MEEISVSHLDRASAADLNTVGGKPLKVIIKDNSIPTRTRLQECIIEIGGEHSARLGIHLKTADWQAHNHHEDVLLQ
jgi:hypothetical protein